MMLERGRPADWSERERVRTDFDHNLVVEAGAGTGKTTLLVSRTLYGIETGRLRLSRVAVVTYLEKAAVELRQRIRARIDDALGADPDHAVRLRLERALVELPEARIGTLHGLGHGILARHAIELGLDPRMTVWDAVETERQRDAALRAWLREPHPEVLDAMRLGVRYGDWEELLRTVARIPQDQTAWGPEPEPVDELLGAFSEALDHLAVVIASVGPPSDDRGVQQVREWRELFSRIADLTPPMRSARLYTLKLHAPAGNQANWGRDKDRLAAQKEMLRTLRERLDIWQAGMAGRTGRRLVRSGEAFSEYFRRWRLERRAVIFDDQVDRVREGLADRAIRDEEAGSLDAILVDEYQDTSPAQVDIVSALAAGPGQSADALPPPGRLVVVGDPKQSIYGFNGANLTHARRWSEALVTRGAALLVPITVNFRSQPSILDTVNDTFSAVFQTVPERDPIYRPLAAFREPATGAQIRRIRLCADDEDLSPDGARAREAAAVADVIQQAVSEGWPVETADGNRPIAFRDITILVPRRTGLDLYRRGLEDAGIPVRGGAGRDFYRRDEVRGLAAILRAVILPDDAVAVLAALRSPFIGVEDRDLMAHQKGGGGFRLDGPVGPEGPVRQALQVLHEWAGRWALQPLPDLLQEVALPFWDEMDGRERANVEALLAECAVYAERWGGAEYVDWLWARVRAGEEGDEAVPEGGSDAVQFSTIHRAKGLEWPMVVVANLRHERIARRDFVIHDPIHQRWALKIGPKRTAAFTEVQEELREEEDAETRRLWYVALTRARDHLIVMESDPEVTLFGRLALDPEMWERPVLPTRPGVVDPVGPRVWGLGLTTALRPVHPGGSGSGDPERRQFGRLFHAWAARMLARPRPDRPSVIERAPAGIRDALCWLSSRPWLPDGALRTEVPVHTDGPPLVDGVMDAVIEAPAGWTVVELKATRNLPAALAEGYRVQVSLYMKALREAGIGVSGGIVCAPFDRREWRVDPGD